MFIKLDEPLSNSLCELLRSSGYEAATVTDQGWGGLRDSALWPHLLREQAFLITVDKGFGDIRVYPPGSHAGILILRVERESFVAYRHLLQTVLQQYRLEALSGSITVAAPGRVRIRRKR